MVVIALASWAFYRTFGASFGGSWDIPPSCTADCSSSGRGQVLIVVNYCLRTFDHHDRASASSFAPKVLVVVYDEADSTLICLQWFRQTSQSRRHVQPILD